MKAERTAGVQSGWRKACGEAPRGPGAERRRALEVGAERRYDAGASTRIHMRIDTDINDF
jgi:hypothetical protein